MFSYTHIVFVFFLQEDFYIYLGPFSAFYLFLPFIFFFFRKILITFTRFFWSFFLCFDNIYLPFFKYVEKKLIFFTRIFFIVIFFTRIFFHLNFFQNFLVRIFFIIRIFSIWIFSSRVSLSKFSLSGEISLSPIIYLGIFFCLIKHLHSSKNA